MNFFFNENNKDFNSISLLLISYYFPWPFCQNFYSFQLYHSNQVQCFYFFNNNNNNSNSSDSDKNNSNNNDDNFNNDTDNNYNNNNIDDITY